MTDIREEITTYVTERVSKKLDTTTLPKEFKNHIIELTTDMFRTRKKRYEEYIDLSELVTEETGLDVRAAQMMIECRYRATITDKSIFLLEVKPMAHYTTSDYDELTADEAIADELYDYTDNFELSTEINYRNYGNKLVDQALSNSNLVICESRDSSYRLIQANEETIIGNGADKLLTQLRDEGVYDSWVGVISDASKTSGPVNINYLPVFGRADKFVTKWFSTDRSEAIKHAKAALREIGWY